MRYLLNTNHAVALLNDDPRMVGRFNQARAKGDEFAITTVGVGELYYGAYYSRRPEDNAAKIRECIIRHFFVYAFDLAAAEEFGRIEAEQRRKGRPIPTADAQIAAVARHHDLCVLTSDAHFREVDNLIVEDWLA